MFYPQGVSLTYHPFFIPHAIVVSAMQTIMPLSNAFSLTHLLIVFSTAVSAYIHILWLFKDKWIALFGAVVFGFSPHVIGHPNHPDIAFVATVPLVLYSFQRGIKENRLMLVISSGLLTGLTTVTSMYAFVCILMMLGFAICAIALSRWRDRRFWLQITLLILAVAVSSFWRVYPLMSDSLSLGAATEWHGDFEVRTDLISNFVNHSHPVFGPLAETFLQTPKSARLSETSYLGYIPLLLACIGVFNPAATRKTLPWVALCAIFLFLRLGSTLNIFGVVFPEVLLPKYYLNQAFPSIFQSFKEADNFMMGAILPLAILSCFGLHTLRTLCPCARRPLIVIIFVGVVAIEYYIPVTGNLIPQGQFDFIDWLAVEEDSGEIHLINLPMGRNSSKRYNLYQSLSGYPHAEGAISRTPDSAFDYIRSNPILDAWRNNTPISCEIYTRERYVSALDQLEVDGFTHVILHHEIGNPATVSYSFRNATMSFHDDFVSIYRLSDLRDSCPVKLNTRHPSIDERHGTIVIFPPTPQEGDHFLRYLRRFAKVDKTVVTIAGVVQANIDRQNSESRNSYSYADLERNNAVWLVDNWPEFYEEQTGANQEGFMTRFKFCERFHEDERTTIDLYLKTDIPCEAVDERSTVEVSYDGGVRLHNVSHDAGAAEVRFYLAWTNDTKNDYGFSIQFFDEDGQKALQYDNAILRELLTVHDIDTTPLPEGIYSVQLIVYDYDTRISQGGTLTDTAERFERELELTEIEV